MLSESKIQCTIMLDFYLKCDSPVLKYQQLMPDMTAFIPMAVWKDGKVVEFLPEPNLKPHGTHLPRSFTFLAKKRKHDNK